MPPITASLLYALVECPHRVWLDATEDPAKRDEVSPFIELLWERGSKFERETIQKLDQPFTDLSSLSPLEKERETLAAMRRGDQLIYSGRISAGDLLGQPDLLLREGAGSPLESLAVHHASATSSANTAGNRSDAMG